MTESEWGRQWREYMAERRLQRESVAQQHADLTVSQRRRLLLVEYHCAQRGCLLLRVWASPYGPAFHKPPYVLSAERNLASSNADGRANNTTDGFNRWKGATDVWVDVKEDPRFGWSLNCRHVAVTVSAADIQTDIETASPGEPIRRRIASVSSPDLRLLPLMSAVVTE